jgi:hypothetical protein
MMPSNELDKQSKNSRMTGDHSIRQGADSGGDGLHSDDLEVKEQAQQPALMNYPYTN